MERIIFEQQVIIYIIANIWLNINELETKELTT